MLDLLHAVGLAGTVDGQPAWPFGVRVASETLVIDRGLARQLALALLAGSTALLLVALGLVWRRRRVVIWSAAAVLVLVAPWPPIDLVLTRAVPTSFHRSPTGFDAASIDRGLALYAAHCLACHGADGRGEGPLAATLPVWPPTLSAGLLWKRSEGELFWHVLHGMRGRDGSVTMPGFAGRLSEADAWAVLDGMKALSAGESARREANWPWPARAPGFRVECRGLASRTLAQWRGQRVRIVAGGAALPEPIEDPRLLTVVLRGDGLSARGSGGGCGVAVVESRAAWQAYAGVAGVPASLLAGTQFIVDRDGWLRAIGRPGEGGWSEDKLLCRSGTGGEAAKAGGGVDGLNALIAGMDGDPVRVSRLGVAHWRDSTTRH